MNDVHSGQDGPLRDLVEVGLWRDKPNVEDIEPLANKFTLEQLAHHAGAQDVLPLERLLERSQRLGAGVDGEVRPQVRSKLRQDIFEQKRIPLAT